MSPTTNWSRARLTKLGNGVKLTTASSDRELVAVESDLSIRLPDSSRALLRLTDGVSGEYDLGLVWPLARIRSENQEMRTSTGLTDLYMPFGHLVFIGEAGNGDLFALVQTGSGSLKPDVYIWNHEDDSRTWCAPDIWTFIEWWVQGRIST